VKIRLRLLQLLLPLLLQLPLRLKKNLQRRKLLRTRKRNPSRPVEPKAGVAAKVKKGDVESQGARVGKEEGVVPGLVLVGPDLETGNARASVVALALAMAVIVAAAQAEAAIEIDHATGGLDLAVAIVRRPPNANVEVHRPLLRRKSRLLNLRPRRRLLVVAAPPPPNHRRHPTAGKKAKRRRLRRRRRDVGRLPDPLRPRKKKRRGTDLRGTRTEEKKRTKIRTRRSERSTRGGGAEPLRTRKTGRKGLAKISVRNWPLWPGCWNTFRRKIETKRGRRRRRRPLRPTPTSLPRIWTLIPIEFVKE